MKLKRIKIPQKFHSYIKFCIFFKFLNWKLENIFTLKNSNNEHYEKSNFVIIKIK